jgi:hypothetical protein
MHIPMKSGAKPKYPGGNKNLLSLGVCVTQSPWLTYCATSVSLVSSLGLCFMVDMRARYKVVTCNTLCVLGTQGPSQEGAWG